MLLGVNARPLVGGRGKGDGLAFTLIPEEPIIAFRKFHFNEDHNWIYLHKNMRVYANVDMWDDEGMGFRVHSVQGDTVSLQNIDVEIRRIRLDEITSVLPDLPRNHRIVLGRSTLHTDRKGPSALYRSIH